MNLLERLHVLHRAWRMRLKHDRHELALLRRNVCPGDTVVDIGANKGAYSYWFSKATGCSGTVIAFEPQPGLVTYLKQVRSAFALDNLQIIESGLSSESGMARLYQPPENPLGGATLQPHSAMDSLEIRLTTLDEFFRSRRQPAVRFIKLDVEGHELQVLLGGKNLLKRDQPTLLFEWAPSRSGEIFDYLDSLGYCGSLVFAKREQWTFRQYQNTQFPAGFIANFSFVPKDLARPARIAA